MKEIIWKYVSPLQSSDILTEFEKKYSIKIPEDLKKCIIENNAGTPSCKCFDLPSENDKVFGGLLSFNEGEPDNIYDNIVFYKAKKALPFATDPAGNFMCVKDNKIFYYDHELDSFTELADTFTAFLTMLHD